MNPPPYPSFPSLFFALALFFSFCVCVNPKNQFVFLLSLVLRGRLPSHQTLLRVFMMTALATTDVTRENAIILLHFEFNWFIEHDFEWFFLWTIMLSLILMLSLYFRLFIVFFEKVAEINLNLNLNLNCLVYIHGLRVINDVTLSKQTLV